MEQVFLPITCQLKVKLDTLKSGITFHLPKKAHLSSSRNASKTPLKKTKVIGILVNLTQEMSPLPLTLEKTKFRYLVMPS